MRAALISVSLAIGALLGFAIPRLGGDAAAATEDTPRATLAPSTPARSTAQTSAARAIGASAPSASAPTAVDMAFDESEAAEAPRAIEVAPVAVPIAAAAGPARAAQPAASPEPAAAAEAAPEVAVLPAPAPAPAQPAAPAAQPSRPSDLDSLMAAAVPVDAPAAAPQVAPAAEVRIAPTREEVMSALEQKLPALQQCAGDLHGLLEVRMTLGQSGRVRTALVTGTFAGTPQGSCIARELRTLRVDAFENEAFEIFWPARL